MIKHTICRKLQSQHFKVWEKNFQLKRNRLAQVIYGTRKDHNCNWNFLFFYFLFLLQLEFFKFSQYLHCVKTACIYFVNLRIQSECGKMRTRKTLDTETFDEVLLQGCANRGRGEKNAFFQRSIGMVPISLPEKKTSGEDSIFPSHLVVSYL